MRVFGDMSAPCDKRVLGRRRRLPWVFLPSSALRVLTKSAHVEYH